MHDEIWFKEPLLPPQELAEETAKGLERLDERDLAGELALEALVLGPSADRGEAIKQYVREKAQGVLRVHRPRPRLLTAEEAVQLPIGLSDLKAGMLGQGQLYLARLGVEFDVLPEGRQAGWAYTNAWCRAFLFAPGSAVQPRVLWLFPQRLYEGGPSTVKVEAGLGFKVGPAEAEAGKIGADLHVGQVTPVTVGFFGDEERTPYWELRAKATPILGAYHFWLIVEQPPGCGAVRLAALGEGDLQTRLFSIPVGPKERAWEQRKSVALT